MPEFTEWLTGVVTVGEAILPSHPKLPSPKDLQESEPVLLEAFHDAAIDLAGPPIQFHPASAKNAAVLLFELCLYLTGFRPADPPPEDRLGVAVSPSDHLSADVILRYLPALHRRIGARGADDPTAVLLEKILKRRPLAGIRADISEPPEAPLDFFNHTGLQMYYAELLLERPRSHWVPPSGKAREWVERVFHENGKPFPTLVVAVAADQEK